MVGLSMMCCNVVSLSMMCLSMMRCSMMRLGVVCYSMMGCIMVRFAVFGFVQVYGCDRNGQADHCHNCALHGCFIC